MKAVVDRDAKQRVETRPCGLHAVPPGAVSKSSAGKQAPEAGGVTAVLNRTDSTVPAVVRVVTAVMIARVMLRYLIVFCHLPQAVFLRVPPKWCRTGIRRECSRR